MEPSPLTIELSRCGAMVTALKFGDEQTIAELLAEGNTDRLALAFAQLIWTTTLAACMTLGRDPDETWQQMLLIVHKYHDNPTK